MAQSIAVNVLNKVMKAPLAVADSLLAGDFEQILSGVVDSEEFKEILDDALSEANVETSLDLTLSKEIYPETADTLKYPVENQKQESEEDSEEDLAALIPIKEPAVFENLLTKVGSIEVEQVPKQVLELSSNETFEQTSNQVAKQVVKNVAESVKPLEKTEENITESENSEQVLDDEMLKDLNIESMSSESDFSEGDSLLRNQSPQEQAVKLMIHNDIETFEVKLPSKPVAEAPQKSVDITPNKIIEQVTKHMESLTNNSKVNIVLNPESLGKVNIQLVNTKEGLSAMFTVTTQEARDLLMKGVDGLKDNLLSHGVSVDNVSVKVSDTQKSEYNSDWTEQEGSRGGNKEQQEPKKEEKDKELFEKMMKGMRK